MDITRTQYFRRILKSKSSLKNSIKYLKKRRKFYEKIIFDRRNLFTYIRRFQFMKKNVVYRDEFQRFFFSPQ